MPGLPNATGGRCPNVWKIGHRDARFGGTAQFGRATEVGRQRLIAQSMIDGKMADTEPQSALVVLVPEAEELVAPFRAAYDAAAAAGMPAHVTILFPFASPAWHLTVGSVTNEHVLERFTQEFAAAAERYLPLSGRATEIALMDNKHGSWTIVTTFSLGRK